MTTKNTAKCPLGGKIIPQIGTTDSQESRQFNFEHAEYILNVQHLQKTVDRNVNMQIQSQSTERPNIKSMCQLLKVKSGK